MIGGMAGNIRAATVYSMSISNHIDYVDSV
jgi:hypothetical protein